ncbi:serine acetyltransferase [Zhouia sp. PK063]|uniref:serine acetyltransferase n=1 Tax=Zhouia sp. PK063 TaxID=3373602 RepID=UPI00379C6DC3
MFLLQDYKQNEGNTKGKIVAFCFRLANISTKNNFYKIILIPYRIFYKLFFEWIIGFEIPYNVFIGKGLRIYHLQSIVINKNTIIGENITIRQNCTIGNSHANGKCPVIGNNVEIGANVCIIGNIHIGDNVKIGAGSVVVKDVPSNCIIVGNPSKIIKKW